MPLHAKISRSEKIPGDKSTCMVSVRFASSTLCRRRSKRLSHRDGREAEDGENLSSPHLEVGNAKDVIVRTRGTFG